MKLTIRKEERAGAKNSFKEAVENCDKGRLNILESKGPVVGLNLVTLLFMSLDGMALP